MKIQYNYLAAFHKIFTPFRKETHSGTIIHLLRLLLAEERIGKQKFHYLLFKERIDVKCNEELTGQVKDSDGSVGNEVPVGLYVLASSLAGFVFLLKVWKDVTLHQIFEEMFGRFDARKGRRGIQH